MILMQLPYHISLFVMQETLMADAIGTLHQNDFDAITLFASLYFDARDNGWPMQ